jgi:primosomal protein N' (replication factor Y)
VKSLAAKGFLQLQEVEALRDPYAGRAFTPTAPLPLTPEQQAAYTAIDAAVTDGRHDVFLLHGVTGSGKTEVYLQSIQRCLDLGREAIVLVPEISLTPQMVERFKGRFGDRVAVLHSRLSHGERFDEWRKIKSGRVKVAIGARSAVFAPFQQIGLIIVDEEHESSYKQEETPKYHARDVAIKRAELGGAVVLLGSATPSLESVFETRRGTVAGGEGRYKLLTMRNRATGGTLPHVNIVDMREELKAGNRSMFSRGLHQAIESRLAKGEQTVLLLNRRGYATFVMCRTCGFVAQCPHCDISLTYHRNSRTMRCHYCGYAEREAQQCPSCSSEHIRHFGTGTQRVEEELSKLFPGIRVIRMDVDTTTAKGSHEKLLTDFRNKRGDVLLGTQMVAKGLDFPDVTLVGVIAADTVLGLPDFRSGERTFQLLTQVAGRAGRHALPGEVFVQTYMPEHYAIVAASGHDFASFARTELQTRESRGYPPFHKMMLITFAHELVQPLMQAAEAFVRELRVRFHENGSEGEDGRRWSRMEVLGPVASPIPRLKDRYRFQCMVKYREESLASRLVAETVRSFEEKFAKDKIGLSIDVDPQYLM